MVEDNRIGLEGFAVRLREAEHAIAFLVLVVAMRGRFGGLFIFNALRGADFHKTGLAGNKSAGR